MENKGLPIVSIVVPYFNGKEFLEDALISVKAQTFKNFEVLVVEEIPP